jgi:DNA-binding NarL/FixJ family response regulator
VSSGLSVAGSLFWDQVGESSRASLRANRASHANRGTQVTRIVLAHAHGLARSGLRALLDARQDIEVVSEAADHAGAVRSVFEHKPDVLLLDWDISCRDDMRVLREIASSGCSTRTVLIGVARSSDEDIWKAIQLGVAGILSDETTVDSLCEGLRKVMCGEHVMGKVGIESLIGSVRNPKPKSTFQLARRKFGVTRREFEVIVAVAAGYSNVEIAQKFSLSCHTVKHHLSHIFDKVGVSNRLELALFSINNGIIEE